MNLLFILVGSLVQAQHFHHARANFYGPIGVMGDHLHPKGTWMASYSYMRMVMDGIRSGTTVITDEEKAHDYVVHEHGYHSVPMNMVMQMHMLGIMWSPMDHWNLMVMIPYLNKEMEMDAHDSTTHHVHHHHQMGTQGFSDIQVTALVNLLSREKWTLHAQFGASFPTGNFHLRDHDAKLQPYPMQLGSGTVDPILSLTFRYYGERYSIGLQGRGLWRFYSNSQNYQLGDQYAFQGWVSYSPYSWLAGSIRIFSLYETPLSPAPSDQIMEKMSPLADGRVNSGRFLVGGGLGCNLQPFSFLNVGLEVEIPFYQYVRGIQMNHTFSWAAGIRYLLSH